MRIKDNRIVDETGRTLILRGCNLGGNSKIPAGEPGWGLNPESLKNPPEASFVGRPFPLEEADTHFSRLKSWGFTFLRFIITWEALEHAGPGIYDEAYLAYLRKILLIAGEKEISVFMDPHQDVWSRWTGGDGAPAWTLELLGMDLSKLESTGAAVNWKQGTMIWPGNYNRYAASTLFTLFFAGKTYAPDCLVEGKNIQDWLQEHYIAAFRHCYRRLKNCKAIAGWGTMNEPHQGLLGHTNLEKPENPMVPLGPVPSPFQAMAAASGRPVKIPVYAAGPGGFRVSSHTILNSGGHNLFKPGFSCPWKNAGVWADERGNPRLLKKDYFALYRGRPVHFADDFLKPFMLNFIHTMKEAREGTLFFIEGAASGGSFTGKKDAAPSWKTGDSAGIVHAFHQYDGFTLFSKTFIPWFTVNIDKIKIILGRKNVAAYNAENIAKGKTWTKDHMENMPCLLGEFGLPFDLNKRKAFKTGDYRVHEKALAMYYDSIDSCLLHSTIWNYSADNTNEYGDGWNGEELSIFSQGSGRAAGGWLRPYPMATAGVPLKITWDRKKGIFTYRFKADAGIESPTEIFLPGPWFGEKPEITISRRPPAEGAPPGHEYLNEERLLRIRNDGYSGETTLTIRGLP
jgi:hypothetical protein